MPTLVAVGDIAIDRADPDSAFQHVRPTLAEADITFAQLETPYSDKGVPATGRLRGVVSNDPRNFPAIPKAGVDVVSVASNHALDHGEAALLDVIERCNAAGIAPIGVGANLQEARRPVYFERERTRVAFLAYCSVAFPGYYAAPSNPESKGRPGCAPMRAITHYQPLEDEQPGTPCQILTMPVQDDLDAVIDDIHSAKQQADIVVVSMHWGVHKVKGLIADYQRTVAQAAIDAGADLILGHHAHLLKGVEVYGGKVVFYSLGNFIFDGGARGSKTSDVAYRKLTHAAYAALGVPEREESSLYTFPSNAKYSVMAKVTFAEKEIQSVGFLPVYINRQADPEIVGADDPRREEVITFLEESGQMAGLNATFRAVGDEYVVEG